MDFILSAFADEAASSLTEQIAACRENGIDHIELRGIDGRNVTDLSIDAVKQVAERLKAEGIKLSAIGPPLGKINVTDDFVEHLEKFKYTAQLANILGTPNIRLFSFYIPRGQSPDSFEEQVLNRLAQFAAAAKQAGVRCCHENEKDIFGDTAMRCLRIFETFKTEIGGIFDFANFVQCGQDTIAAHSLLEKHVDYYHIKDARTDGSVVPAGQGDGNIQKILKQTVSKKGCCYLTLEPHLTIFDGFAKLERDRSSLSNPYTFGSSRKAFSAAANALKTILQNLGYVEETGPQRIWRAPDNSATR